MWKKQGVIFRTDGQHPWMHSHACVPTAMLLPGGERIRIYFAPRNEKNQSLPAYIDVDREDPSTVLHLSPEPLLALGERGTFDDGGIMPCSVIRSGEDVYLYYVGWNPSVSVPYRNAVGVAVSRDGGETFERVFPGPIVDRSPTEPFFTASPCVRREGGTWHMWYASGTGFVTVDGQPEPLYVIKYARSSDGLRWSRDNVTCIHPHHSEEANARPTVIADAGRYRMWFCYRGSRCYRDGADSYRIGYAESTDAVHWTRNDAAAGIACSDTGWDDAMQTYPNVLVDGDRTILFYNGNGFGRTGIGYALWNDES
jgi:predicted GH43/DUF377 family glycosyl hydrolase